MENAVETTQTTTVMPTLAELAKKVKAFRSAIGATLKINKSGNLYIKHGFLQAWSLEKQKVYGAGINIDLETARCLVNNPALIEDIRNFLSLVPSKVGMSKEQNAEFVKLFTVEKKVETKKS